MCLCVYKIKFGLVSGKEATEAGTLCLVASPHPFFFVLLSEHVIKGKFEPEEGAVATY